MSKVRTNKTYRELQESSSRISVFQGGSRSGKTYNIVLWLVISCLTKWDNQKIDIVRKTLPSLKASVLLDFLAILHQLGEFSEKDYNKTEQIYRIGTNEFWFYSIDQEQKVRGQKRNILFVNEANELKLDDWIQLSIRTQDKIILDYNPSMEYHWIYDHVIVRDDCDFFHSTYLDNPFLEDALIHEIENLKNVDENYWKIYGLGEKGQLKGLIYTKWKQCKKMPEFAKKEFYGLDFGYTNDPTALIHIMYAQGELWVDEIIYRTNMTNNDIVSVLKSNGIGYDVQIWADSAEPKSIREIRDAGFNIKGVVKGADSVVNGIDIVKRYQINITERSVNTIKEIKNYKWLENSNGDMTNKPVDLWNHSLDAIRYGCMSKFKRGIEFVY